MKKLILTGMILAASVLYGTENKGSYIIKSEGFRNEKGSAIVSLYRKGDDLKKSGFVNIKGEIKGGQCQFDIKNINYGKYAVKIIHDENSNGKFDMGVFGTEGVGVSKNIKIKKPPKYEEVEIELNEKNKSIFIKIQYPTIFDFISGGLKHGE